MTSQRTANPWNQDQPFPYEATWFGAPLVKRMINSRISGNEDVDWLQHLWAEYLAHAPDSQVLILGSSEGRIETFLRQSGHRGKIIASDIAENAIARAKRKITDLGFANVEYVCADLNYHSFRGTFDFIIAEGVLHHIRNIERCLRMLDAKLAPSGKLLAVEFVGPFRFQVSDLQLRWIQTLLNTLPRALRKPFPRDDCGHYPASGEEAYRYHFQRFSEEWVILFDPSEAVSGPQLKELLPKIFKVEREIGYGGPILSYIAEHFDFAATRADAIAERWLNLLMDAERLLIDSAVLQDEFVSYVASKEPSRSQ